MSDIGGKAYKIADAARAEASSAYQMAQEAGEYAAAALDLAQGAHDELADLRAEVAELRGAAND
ncbi:MAG: hypothetical protein ACWA40_09635 [Planktomarina sp.]